MSTFFSNRVFSFAFCFIISIYRRATTFTAFYGPLHNSQFSKLPRQISRYLRGIITSSRTQFPFDIPLQITRFFSLHTREPTFSTLPTGLGTVPIRSRAFHLSFHTQVVGLSSFPGHFRKCFIFLQMNPHSGRFIRYYLKTE